MRTAKKKPAAGGDRFRVIDDLRARIDHPVNSQGKATAQAASRRLIDGARYSLQGGA
jgi:hypothetical protein